MTELPPTTPAPLPTPPGPVDIPFPPVTPDAGDSFGDGPGSGPGDAAPTISGSVTPVPVDPSPSPAPSLSGADDRIAALEALVKKLAAAAPAGAAPVAPPTDELASDPATAVLRTRTVHGPLGHPHVRWAFVFTGDGKQAAALWLGEAVAVDVADLDPE